MRAEQRCDMACVLPRGVTVAALLSGGSRGREAREAATAIFRQERTALDQRLGGRSIGFWTRFQVEPAGFAGG